MNTKLLLAAVAIIGIIGGFLLLYPQRREMEPAPKDYKDATYTIEGQRVTLIKGVSKTEAAPGSASQIVTTYFGNDATGDVNGDGIPDTAFLLTQSTGGSGTFFYLVAAIKQTNGTYAGTDAVLLGDRIAPQTTEIREGKVIVNYAERAAGEPMTTQPSVGKSMVLLLDPATLRFGEVAQNFEGEADPSRMTLGMKTWKWVSALYSDGRTIVPKRPDAFTLTFGNGTFSAKTDCNGVSGNYSAAASTLSFTSMMSTLMYCDGSQESEFTQLLTNTSGYHFTSKGELILDLKFDSGTALFR